MTAVLAIVLLVVLGLLLMILEVLVIPGTTFVGIVGFILLTVGLWISFDTYGPTIGLTATGTTIVAMALLFYFTLRSKTWKNIMLKENIESCVDAFEQYRPSEGEHGVSISRLAPMGKVLISGHEFEAKAQSSYIDEGSEIEVISVESNRITVKLKS